MSYIIDKSFQLIRTNPKLTTNLKINVSSDLSLYLESFNTNKQLSDDKYKHFLMSKDSYLEDKIPIFYKNLPHNIAYDVKDLKDKTIVYNSYKQQYDDIYWSGVKKVEENKFYKEEYEYFAPLYLKYNEIPSHFIIMRVDEPGIYELKNIDYSISQTNKSNFREKIIEKWKNVSVYDLSIKTDLGYWLDNNFISNERFPDSPFEFDSNPTSFSRWFGIDYNSGAYTEKSQLIKDKIWYEQPHFKLEEYIIDGYERNNLIFPNILNLNFLFDDNPGTPFKYNKYSINRYFGFYVDMEKIQTLTSYKQLPLKNNIHIKNNIFLDDADIPTSPFFDTDNEWDDNEKYYIYAKDNLSEVKKVYENNLYKYTIISEYDISIDDISTDYEIDIDFVSDENDYKNIIKSRYGLLNIDLLITDKMIKQLYADLYFIEINGIFHVLETNNDTNEYIIRTDYGIISNKNTLKYWKSDDITEVLIEDKINKTKPLVYDIYRIRFRDIKDFDYDRIETSYAEYDFDLKDKYVETKEEKLYCIEHMDASTSIEYKKYDGKSINSGKIIIASSEYVADDELYEINKYGLTKIWDKNQSIVKWGYSGSISHSDYPYKLNNNSSVGGLFNKTTDIYSVKPNIFTKTNDYFYGLGTYISGTSTKYEYKHYYTQSLNIESDSYGSGKNIDFDLDEYLKSEIDYFDYYFNNTRYINNNNEYIQTQQYSMFNTGTKYNPSTTLFKGIKYSVSNISSVIRDETGKIIKYVLNNNTYNQYKFSIINNYSTNNYSGIVYSGDYKNNIKYNGDLGQDNICVLLNEKYKNILIIINTLSIVPENNIHINNISYYDHDAKYNNGVDLTGNTMSANVFIENFLSDKDISYFYVDKYGELGKSSNNTLINISSWKNYFPPIKINILNNDVLELKQHSYKTAVLKGPKTNIYDKYKNNFTETIYSDSFITEPLSRIIEINDSNLKPRAQFHGEELRYSKKIYRYNGAYEPIFKNIELFKSLDYYNNDLSSLIQKKCNINYSGQSWLFYDETCTNISAKYNILLNNKNIDVDSDFLILSGFKFNIPKTAKINGFSVNINRYAADVDYSNIKDKNIEFINKSTNTVISNNGAKTSKLWSENATNITYGSNYNLWEMSGLTVDFLNSDDFALQIKVVGRSSVDDMINIANINCICINIHYSLIDDVKYSTKIERNLKFDENLLNFGMINIIGSKINENDSMLKLKNAKNDESIYPMVDEIGYSYYKKFIFKSTWDSDYYIKTKNNIE